MNQIQKNLISIAYQKKWYELSQDEKKNLINKIKADATVKLIQANQCVQSKNYSKAKQLLIYIGDSCSYVSEPDQQIKKWYQFSCNYLAILHKKMIEKENNKNIQTIYEDWDNKDDLIILKYNKFTTEFQFQRNLPESYISRQIRQHVTKLNSILFGFNQNQNIHSLTIILRTYWVSFLIAAILILSMIAYLVGYLEILQNSDSQQWAIYPLMGMGLIFLIPIFLVYHKQPMFHDDNFFQMKLGQQIKQINQTLSDKGLNISFKMPYGSQINITIEREIKNDYHAKKSCHGQIQDQSIR